MRAVRCLDNGFYPEIGNVWLHLAQFVRRNDTLNRRDHVFGGADKEHIRDQWRKDFQVSLFIAVVSVNDGDIG